MVVQQITDLSSFSECYQTPCLYPRSWLRLKREGGQSFRWNNKEPETDGDAARLSEPITHACSSVTRASCDGMIASELVPLLPL